MKYLNLLLLIILWTANVQSKTIKVAIIDTGYDFNSTWPNAYKIGLNRPKICSTGHKDFTSTSIQDTHRISHGTHIASLIAKGNQNIDYCLLILKFHDESKDGALESEIKALKYAIEQKVDIINLSLNGLEYSKEECQLIKQAIDNNIVIVTAVGNEGKNLEQFSSYPAMCDNRTIKVINGTSIDNVAKTSNYITNFKLNYYYENGNNILGLATNNSYINNTGTSQSAAIVTGKILNSFNKLNSIEITKYSKRLKK